MTLYCIDANIRAALDSMVDPETGEMSDVALATLYALNAERQEKIENIALYYKNLLANAAAIKAEEEALHKRRQSIENHAARLKQYLSDAMEGEVLETARVKISWRKSTYVQVHNEADFMRLYSGSEYLTVKDPTINKTAVASALRAGETIQGAELAERASIQVK